jgi:hypothetical protein
MLNARTDAVSDVAATTACRIATCPLAAAVRPKHMSVMTAKSTVVTEAAADEDSDSFEAEQ